MSAPAPKRGNRKSDPPVVDPPPSNPVANEGSDPPELERDKIARLAYSYWEARGRDGGSPDEDWLRAEQELRARQ